MTEHMKVFIGFHSGRVKAFVLLGYGAVSLDECPPGGVICKGPIIQWAFNP